MPDIVNVLHPAALRCIHRTPGRERVDLIQVRTPLRLREIEPGDMEQVAMFTPREVHGDKAVMAH